MSIVLQFYSLVAKQVAEETYFFSYSVECQNFFLLGSNILGYVKMSQSLKLIKMPIILGWFCIFGMFCLEGPWGNKTPGWGQGREYNPGLASQQWGK